MEPERIDELRELRQLVGDAARACRDVADWCDRHRFDVVSLEYEGLKNWCYAHALNAKASLVRDLVEVKHALREMADDAS